MDYLWRKTFCPLQQWGEWRHHSCVKCPGLTALCQALEDESHLLTERWWPGAYVQPERGWRDVGQKVQGVRRINKKNKSWEAAWVGGTAKLNLFFRKTSKCANAARAARRTWRWGSLYAAHAASTSSKQFFLDFETYICRQWYLLCMDLSCKTNKLNLDYEKNSDPVAFLAQGSSSWSGKTTWAYLPVAYCVCVVCT